MRSLLSLLVVVVLCLAVVGFFRGWFSVSGDGRGTESSKITLTLDSDKMKADAEQAKEKTMELSGKVKEEANELADRARDKVNSDGQ